MKKNKMYIAISAVVVVILLALLFVVFKNKSTGNQNGGTEGTSANNTATEENGEGETEEVQVGLSDLEMTDTIKSDLNELNTACTKFYTEHKDDAQLVSAYGFLYSLSMDDNVTVKKLVSEKYFKKTDEIGQYTDLLLIRPSDYAEVSEKTVEGNELKIFTGFNTKDGYYVSSDGIEGTMLSEEKYNDLVFRYICSHGEILSPASTDAEYKNIVAALNKSGTDIKFLSYDEKYAVVVTGLLADARDVREYLLTKKDGAWSVALEGIESQSCPKQFVNLQYPDVDFGLFPLYTIADFDLPKTDMNDYVPSLKQLGMMNEDETVTYGCGTGHFVYIVTSTNKKLLGVLDDNRKLQFYQMNNVTEAKNSMMNIQKNAPTYILKYAD
jgi:hypothetical protein